jgi:cytochrome P450
MLDDDAHLPLEKSELNIIKDITATLYLAGSDTTVAAVISFFLAMLVYPDVQRKAQAEVDRVVGKDRLPEIEDAPQLPYVQGVVNECLRWLPVTPLG